MDRIYINDLMWAELSFIFYSYLWSPTVNSISEEASPWYARATDIYEFVNMCAGIIWITKRQSIVWRDKCSSENEVLSTAHQLHSSSKILQHKNFAYRPNQLHQNFVQFKFNILQFNGKSSLFIRAKKILAFFFLWHISMADKMEYH